VHAVLGGLARDDEPTARLRDTVWAYLSEGGSRAAAAGALHLHRNTIQYRLGKAERARGRPLDDDRLALEVALLACRVLGPAVLRSD
jgi:DNA-binding PucR family transcriptional regulator